MFLKNIILCPWLQILSFKKRKRAKIRKRYNQEPHLTQDTNGKVTHSQLDITNKSQDVSPFPAGDHKASINRRARKHNKNKTELKKNDPQKKHGPKTVFTGGLKPFSRQANLILRSDVYQDT